jgi:uncharacterized protein
VKLDTRQLPPEGVVLIEDFSPGDWELDTQSIKFLTPVQVTARITKVSNFLNINLDIGAKISLVCSRCLADIRLDFQKNVELNYPIDPLKPKIELDPQIREEIILEYPMKPLCSPNCKGLCPDCGVNLNQEECKCGIV